MSKQLVVGFTGSRRGLSFRQLSALERVLRDLMPPEVHHGDCIGADAEFHDLCRHVAASERTHIFVVGHPPVEEGLRAFKQCDALVEAKTYLERDKAIVDASALLIACPHNDTELKRGGGTWATVRFARALKVTRFIIYTDGVTDREQS